MTEHINTLAQKVTNCNASDCLSNLPGVNANENQLQNLLAIFFGVIGAVFTAAYVVQFIMVLMNPRGGVMGATEIAAALVPVAIAAAITLALIQSALSTKHRAPEPAKTNDAE